MIRHRVIGAVLGAALVLSGSGCAERGQIVSKTYTPGYTTYIPMSCGKGCMTVVPQYYPPCWGIKLDNGQEDCIDEDVWNRHPVGSYYDSEKP